MKLGLSHICCFLFFVWLCLPDKALFAHAVPDTIHVKADELIILNDSIIAPLIDTSVFIPDGIIYKVRKNPYYRSKRFYDSLYYKSRNSVLFRSLYALTINYSPTVSDTLDFVRSTSKFEPFKGKTIASIKLVKVDILEGSVYDTSIKAISSFGKLLNRIHVKTKDITIEHNLLFHLGERVEPVMFSDNERILRQLPGVQNARIVLTPENDNPNKVVVTVITQDVFPYIVSLDVKNIERYDLKIENANFLGLSHRIGNKFLIDFDHAPVIGNDMFYSINNLYGSFINTRINYYNAFSTQKLALDFSKEFLSPLTKYGGALSIQWEDAYYETSHEDSAYKCHYAKNHQEIWLGRAFQIGPPSSGTNITISASLERDDFTKRPWIDYDTNYFFHNRHIGLGSIKFSRLYYYEVQLLKNFGKTEDVPAGFMLGVTAGGLKSEFIKRPYLGFDIAFGKLVKKVGFFGAKVEWGGLIKNKKYSQAIFKFKLNWFSQLSRMGLYRLRHFIELDLSKTIANDRKTDIDFQGLLSGLHDDKISGRSTLVLNLESVAFSPWFFYGFRFAPFVHADMGLISDHRNVFASASVYYSFGVGIRICNESLAYNTLVIRFSFLPRHPDGYHLWDLHFAGSTPGYSDDLEIRQPHMVNGGVVNIFN